MSSRPAPHLLVAPGVLGLMAGLVGSFLQAAEWHGFPWGLLAALLLSALVFLASGWAVGSRHGAVSAGAAWLVTVFLLRLWPRREGDVVLVDQWQTELWYSIGGLLVLAAITVPYDQIARWVAEGIAEEEVEEGDESETLSEESPQVTEKP